MLIFQSYDDNNNIRKQTCINIISTVKTGICMFSLWCFLHPLCLVTWPVEVGEENQMGLQVANRPVLCIINAHSSLMFLYQHMHPRRLECLFGLNTFRLDMSGARHRAGSGMDAANRKQLRSSCTKPQVYLLSCSVVPAPMLGGTRVSESSRLPLLMRTPQHLR